MESDPGVTGRPPGILIIHPGALGDVLQAVPALRHLRARGPKVHLAFAGQPRLGRLLAELAVIEESLSFDGLGLEALFTSGPLPPALLRATARFSRIVSWFGSRDATYRERLGALVADTVVAPPGPEDEAAGPVWRYLMSTLASEGPVRAERISPIGLPAALRTRARQILDGRGIAERTPLLVVHPGSGGAWKQWRAEHFAEVIGAARRRRGTSVLIHQGPADAEAVERLLARLEAPAPRLIEPELGLLAGVLGAAQAYLGGDSGVSHLAAAVGAPSVILFPRATRQRWAPWNPTAIALELTGEADDVHRVTRETDDLLERGGTGRDAARGECGARPTPH